MNQQIDDSQILLGSVQQNARNTMSQCSDGTHCLFGAALYAGMGMGLYEIERQILEELEQVR